MDIQEINLRRSDFEAMHPVARLFNFDHEKLTYFGDAYDDAKRLNDLWSTWCACVGLLYLETNTAKAQAVPEQVLDAPACVGGGAFQKGVKWSTVIGAAQRHYENDGHHEAPAICIRDQLRVASGHSVVVPKEPTYEMLEAGSEARSRTEGHIASIWEAMIEALEPTND